MKDITRKRQFYLERTLYRNKNLNKKAKKELQKFKMNVYPLNTPKLSELENGLNILNAMSKETQSKQDILEQIKKTQKSKAAKSIDEGRAFGTMSKNKYTMTKKPNHILCPVPYIRSQRMTFLKADF